jgi:phage terminase small subunit
MAVLKNPRHERFAQELAKGRTADRAYAAAGYKENRGNATRLRADLDVSARVAELQERGARLTEVTVQSLIEEAEEARLAAMEAGQYAAAISAIKEKGILSGKRIERAERGSPGDFERMTDDELREYLETETRQFLGLEESDDKRKGRVGGRAKSRAD